MQPDEGASFIRDFGSGIRRRHAPIGRRQTGGVGLNDIAGLSLMRAFMDEVSFNENGTELTMVKRSNRGSHAEAGPKGSAHRRRRRFAVRVFRRLQPEALAGEGVARIASLTLRVVIDRHH